MTQHLDYLNLPMCTCTDTNMHICISNLAYYTPHAYNSTHVTGDFESEECRRKKAKQVSKWSGYLEEENDGLIEMESAEPPNHYNSWSGGAVSESHYNDQIVEEDIHPDFT